MKETHTTDTHYAMRKFLTSKYGDNAKFFFIYWGHDEKYHTYVNLDKMLWLANARGIWAKLGIDFSYDDLIGLIPSLDENQYENYIINLKKTREVQI
jgi:hypothetical protein